YTLMVLKLGDFFARVVSSTFEDEGLEIMLEDVFTGEYLAGDSWDKTEFMDGFSSTKIIHMDKSEHAGDNSFEQQKGRQWRLMIRAAKGYNNQLGIFERNLFLIAGTLISLLMALYLHNQKNQTRQIKATVDEQTIVLARNLQALQETHAFNESVLDTALDTIISIDEKGVVGRFNQAAEQLFGYDSHEVIGQNIKMLMPDSYARHHDSYLKNYAETGKKSVIGTGREVVALHKNGLKIPIYLALSDTGCKGRFRFTGIIHDLTEINEARAILSSQKIAMDQHAVIATTDIKGTITDVNDKFCELSGYTKAELIGQNHRLLNSGNQDKNYWKQMFKTIASGKVWNDEVRNRSKDGTIYWVDTTIVPTLGSNGKPESYIAIRTDITHQKLMQETLKKANDELELLSKTDALTKIANRRAYEERLLREIDSTRRSHTMLALLMIDIDYFKPFNDNYGHDSGDLALSRVAGAIKDSLPRATDLAARFGGEEFIVLLPTTGAEGAYKVAERIRANVKALAITHEFSQVMDSVTVSIGISSLTGDSLNEVDLLKQADDALYESKRAGRNRCTIFTKTQAVIT
ncbi:MAG: diguanylate cyclase, partial [Proteobacteria bacterium]|nr:diguanylate cyclase [Pseudomonadota bacterium]